MNLENIVNKIGLNDFMFVCIFIGYIIAMLNDFIVSFMNYLNEKSWRINDYEKIIYDYIGTYDGIDIEEKEIIINAHNNYKKRLNKVNNIENLKNKISNLFKKKK